MGTGTGLAGRGGMGTISIPMQVSINNLTFAVVSFWDFLHHLQNNVF